MRRLGLMIVGTLTTTALAVGVSTALAKSGYDV